MTPRVLRPIVKEGWLFRVSLLELEGEPPSIMLWFVRVKNRENFYIRFFDDEDAAGVFSEDLIAGKFDELFP